MYSPRTSRRFRSPVISIRSRHSRRALAIHLSAIAFARGAWTGVFDDPHADGGEYGVEGRGELGVPVADQELQAASLVFEVHQEVAGLLDHPRTKIRVESPHHDPGSPR